MLPPPIRDPGVPPISHLAPGSSITTAIAIASRRYCGDHPMSTVQIDDAFSSICVSKVIVRYSTSAISSPISASRDGYRHTPIGAIEGACVVAFIDTSEGHWPKGGRLRPAEQRACPRLSVNDLRSEFD